VTDVAAAPEFVLPERPAAQRDRSVAAWMEPVTIPTYEVPPPDPNPMFLEKRVYQGSSGRVYPNPFTDRLSDDRVDHAWTAVHLENRYVRLMVLPEIGGRIHVGLDRTNGYDFFYRQNVIKPALVGLLGPWISGGVEFNWPQHHRPSTYAPVDWSIEEHADGSVTVWCSEHEPMDRMKGMHGITLHPDSALVEVRVRLVNRTPLTQTFLWWANVAARVHDRYQSFFPPDVTYVADHAKRAMSRFPVARGTYYGVEYGSRQPDDADLTWYRNIPVPTSYMAMGSEADFFGGYDHAAEAGFVHWADHHIAPGKKQWTWGNHAFGHAWDRELTDADGPYVELMAGVFTDNQPDFSFLAPYETRTFSQWWYPIRAIGPAHEANLDAAVSLGVEGRTARVGVSVTRPIAGARVLLEAPSGVALDRRLDLAPDAPFVAAVTIPSALEPHDLRLRVEDADGALVIDYRPARIAPAEPPPPATEPPLPAAIAGQEALFLTGRHLEQYRHATRDPGPYWAEAVRRDPGDSRAHTALGAWHLRRGELDLAERHLTSAWERLTERNPNPAEGEPAYLSGVTLALAGRLDAAAAAFAKAGWIAGWRSPAQTGLAGVRARQGRYAEALVAADAAVDADPRNATARMLHAAFLRRLGRTEDALAAVSALLRDDPHDAWARHERDLLAGTPTAGRPLPGGPQLHLDVAHDYARAGLFDDAIGALARILDPDRPDAPAHPMIHYTIAWLADALGDAGCARRHAALGRASATDLCFPSRVEEIAVLEHAQRLDPGDPRAPYYLGLLLYDRRRYAEAIAAWTRARRLDPTFGTVHRNLGIAEWNVRHRPGHARASYRRAIAAAPDDARIRYEWDQLRDRLGDSPAARLRELDERPDLVAIRDDLTVERLALLDVLGRHDEVLEVLRTRRFHPWEGGEGLVSGLWVRTNVAIARRSLEAGDPAQAIEALHAAGEYPPNLGEGKHLLTSEHELHLLLGVAFRALGDDAAARQWLERAAAPELDPATGPTEAWYWRSLALAELGRGDDARGLAQRLLRGARRRAREEVRIDYFATSLPTLLVFDDDLGARNRTSCRYLEGLALDALGRRAQALRAFGDTLARQPDHPGAAARIRDAHARGGAGSD
jgi:tetratricopeptide (TPR) repeat protein